MRPALALAAKDARVELRARELLSATMMLGFLVVAVGLLAFGGGAGRADAAAGVLWIGFAFASALGFGRAFLAEKDRGTWDALLSLPVERGSLYLGKVASNLGLLLVVAIVAVPAYFAIARVAWSPASIAIVAIVVALGCTGLAASGTILAALAAETRARETLVPVLLAPVALPVLIAAVAGTREALAGAGFPAVRGELMLLLGYDVALLAASWLLFDYVVE